MNFCLNLQVFQHASGVNHMLRCMMPHPRPRSRHRVHGRSALSGFLTLAAGIIFSFQAHAQGQQMSPASDMDSAAVIFAYEWPDSRSALTGEVLQGPGPVAGAPLDLAAFLPGGQVFPGENIRGELTFTAVPLSLERIGPDAPAEIAMPDFTIGITVHGDRLVPVPLGEGIVVDRRRPVHLIPGVGRVWREVADRGRSRALVPVSLIDSATGDVRNGLLTFLYGDGRPISDGYIQFSQETAPRREANAWGRVPLSFVSVSLPQAEARIEAFRERLASGPAYRNWNQLETRFEREFSGFDGALGDAGSISASGIIVDEVVYLRGCPTRHGPYPFCRQMRHAIHGLTYPLLAAVALAHFAEHFGIDVLSQTVGSQVPELAGHRGWRDVRMINLINMASGLGEAEPTRVSTFVAADADATALEIRRARTIPEKLDVALRFPFYSWGPGQVFRHRFADSFGLALSLDRLAKRFYGPDRSLRTALQQNIFTTIGIPRLQMRMTDGETVADRVPDLAEGLLATTGEVVRLSILLRRAQSLRHRTPLAARLIRDALSTERGVGRLTGQSWPDGEGSYHFGFWRIPYRSSERCLVYIPTGLGRGGNVVNFMPNDMTAFRIADGDSANPATRDSRDMRRIGNEIRPFCG